MNVNCDNYIGGKSIPVTASSYTPVSVSYTHLTLPTILRV